MVLTKNGKLFSCVTIAFSDRYSELPTAFAPKKEVPNLSKHCHSSNKPHVVHAENVMFIHLSENVVSQLSRFAHLAVP